MKLLPRVGLLTFLFVILIQIDTYGAELNTELNTNWSNHCSAEFKEIPTGNNPSFQHLNCLLTNAAIQSDIPPEVVKAIADEESFGWKQFSKANTPLIANDGGIGIMQITNKSKYDQEKLKTDVAYNIQAGVEVLNEMYARTDLPKITGAKRSDIESWYFAVMAYNGTVHSNSPLYRATGEKNKSAYQEKVFNNIYENSFLLGNKNYIISIPIKVSDLNYANNAILSFNKKQYDVTDRLNQSTYFFKKAEKVLVTTAVNFRSAPNSSSKLIQSLPKHTVLTITGDFKYTTNADSKNQFVWYPAKTTDGKVGYISSAYITNKPIIDGVLDQQIEFGTPFDAKGKIKAIDAEDGDLTKVIEVKGTVNHLKAGIYPLTYSVTDKNGNKVIATRNVTVKKLEKVTSLKLSSSTDNSLKITWKKQTGVTGYKIYNVKSGKEIIVKGADTTSYTFKNLSPATSYQFKVKSYKTVKTDYNGEYSSTITAMTKPAQVKNVKVSSSTTNSLKLTWTKQSGVTGYKIYRYDSNSKSYKHLTTIPNNTNYYTNSNLKVGTTYTYKVLSYKTVNKVDHPGAYSSPLTTTTKPATVTLSSVSKASSTSMKVDWKKVTASNGYQIQYSTSNKFTSGTTKTITINNKNTVTSTIKSLKKGQKYYVRVSAYVTLSNNNKYPGAWSTVKTVTVK